MRNGVLRFLGVMVFMLGSALGMGAALKDLPPESALLGYYEFVPEHTPRPELAEVTPVPEPKPTPVPVIFVEEPVVVEETIVETPVISDDDLALFALLVMGEAEGEPEEGKRLVIDTVLNRVDDPHFPDTIFDVIWQKNQFSAMWSDRLTRCEVREDICDLILEEMAERTDRDVIFFNADHYSIYGSPLFQVGNHYFSSYE